MPIAWPSERVTRAGLVEVALASVALPVGVLTLRRAGLASWSTQAYWPLLAGGMAALVVCGLAVFRFVRRREYPWVLAFAAVALPLFEPARAPYHVADRVLLGARDLVLVGAAVLFLWRTIRGADELERRIHLEALAWSYAAVMVALVAVALVEDLLPPLRGTWVASAMLGTWVVAWLASSFRYQR